MIGFRQGTIVDDHASLRIAGEVEMIEQVRKRSGGVSEPLQQSHGLRLQTELENRLPPRGRQRPEVQHVVELRRLSAVRE